MKTTTDRRRLMMLGTLAIAVLLVAIGPQVVNAIPGPGPDSCVDSIEYQHYLPGTRHNAYGPAVPTTDPAGVVQHLKKVVCSDPGIAASVFAVFAAPQGLTVNALQAKAAEYTANRAKWLSDYNTFLAILNSCGTPTIHSESGAYNTFGMLDGVNGTQPVFISATVNRGRTVAQWPCGRKLVLDCDFQPDLVLPPGTPVPPPGRTIITGRGTPPPPGTPGNPWNPGRPTPTTTTVPGTTPTTPTTTPGTPTTTTTWRPPTTTTTWTPPTTGPCNPVQQYCQPATPVDGSTANGGGTPGDVVDEEPVTGVELPPDPPPPPSPVDPGNGDMNTPIPGWDDPNTVAGS